MKSAIKAAKNSTHSVHGFVLRLRKVTRAGYAHCVTMNELGDETPIVLSKTDTVKLLAGELAL